jgi:hypothetical protein
MYVEFCVDMVRPEGFEPPTLWFEAKCSIQLSYGRGVEKCCYESSEKMTGRQLGCWLWLRGWWGRRRSEEREGFDDVEAAAPEELMDDGFGEARGVVLDADGLLSFVEFEFSNSVDFA